MRPPLPMPPKGARPQQRVDEVDAENGIIRTPPKKMTNKRWGVIPIAPPVAGLLARRMKGKAADAPLFPVRGADRSP